jgi:hypothetical protein
MFPGVPNREKDDACSSAERPRNDDRPARVCCDCGAVCLPELPYRGSNSISFPVFKGSSLSPRTPIASDRSGQRQEVNHRAVNTLTGS